MGKDDGDTRKPEAPSLSLVWRSVLATKRQGRSEQGGRRKRFLCVWIVFVGWAGREGRKERRERRRRGEISRNGEPTKKEGSNSKSNRKERR